MEAVYTLLDIERAVPEVFNSTYDIRAMLGSIGPLRDGKGIDIPGPDILRRLLLKKIDGTEIANLLEQFHLLSD
jgi:oleate hydratase